MFNKVYICSLLAAAFLAAASAASAEEFCVKPLKGGHTGHSGVEQIPTGSATGGQAEAGGKHQCPHLQHQTGGCPISHGAGSNGSRYLSKCPPDLPVSEIAFSMHYDSLVPQVTGAVPEENGRIYTPYLLQKVAEPQRLEPRPPTI